METVIHDHKNLQFTNGNNVIDHWLISKNSFRKFELRNIIKITNWKLINISQNYIINFESIKTWKLWSAFSRNVNNNFENHIDFFYPVIISFINLHTLQSSHHVYYELCEAHRFENFILSLIPSHHFSLHHQGMHFELLKWAYP